MVPFPLFNPSTLNFQNKKNTNYDWESYYLVELSRLARTKYRWEQLPDSLSQYAIEEALLSNSAVGFYRPQSLNTPLMVTGTPSDNNINGEPTCLTLVKNDAKLQVLPDRIHSIDDDAVICIDNIWGVSDWYYITFYAHKLANVRNKIEANMKTIITPLLASGNARSISAVKQQIQRALDGTPVLIEDKSKVPNGSPLLQSYNLHQEYYVDKFKQYLDSLMHEILNHLGVNTVDVEKQERLVTGEVDANNDRTQKMLDEGLYYRRKAVKEMNQKFGLNISVKMNVANSPIIDPNKPSEEGGKADDNGSELSNDQQ